MVIACRLAEHVERAALVDRRHDGRCGIVQVERGAHASAAHIQINLAVEGCARRRGRMSLAPRTDGGGELA